MFEVFIYHVCNLSAIIVRIKCNDFNKIEQFFGGVMPEKKKMKMK